MQDHKLTDSDIEQMYQEHLLLESWKSKHLEYLKDDASGIDFYTVWRLGVWFIQRHKRMPAIDEIGKMRIAMHLMPSSLLNNIK